MLRNIIKKHNLLKPQNPQLKSLGAFLLNYFGQENQNAEKIEVSSDKEKIYTNVLRLEALMRTKIFFLIFDYYYWYISTDIPDFIDQTRDPETGYFSNPEIFSFIFGRAIEFEPNLPEIFNKNLKDICEKLNIDQTEWENWIQNLIDNPENQSEEVKKWLFLRQKICYSLLSGVVPLDLCQEIEVPDFINYGFYVRYCEYRARSNFKIEVEGIKYLIDKRGENFEADDEFSNFLMKKAIEIFEADSEFLERDEFFGKGWSERYDIHPILLERFFRIRFMNSEDKSEINAKIENINKVANKLTGELFASEEFTLENLSIVEEAGIDVLNNGFIEIYEELQKEG